MNSMHNSFGGSGGYPGPYPGYVPPPAALPYYNGYPGDLTQVSSPYYGKPAAVPPGYSSGMGSYSAPPINNSSMYYQQYGLGYQYGYTKYGLGSGLGSNLGYSSEIAGASGITPPSLGGLQAPTTDLGLTGSMFSKGKYSGNQGSPSPLTAGIGVGHGSSSSLLSPVTSTPPSPGPHNIPSGLTATGATPSPPVDMIESKKDLDKMRRCQVCGQMFRLMSECLAHMKSVHAVHEAPISMYSLQHGAGGHLTQTLTSTAPSVPSALSSSLGPPNNSRTGGVGAPDSPLMALERMGWGEKQGLLPSLHASPSPLTPAYTPAPAVTPGPQHPSAQHLATQHLSSQHPSSQLAASQHPSSQHTSSQHPPSQHPSSQHPSSQHPSQHPSSQHPSTQHASSQHPPPQHSSAQHPSPQHPTSQHPPSQHPSSHPSSQHPSQHPSSQLQPAHHPTSQNPPSQHSTPQHPSNQHPSTQHPSSQHPSTQHSSTQHNTSQHSSPQQHPTSQHHPQLHSSQHTPQHPSSSQHHSPQTPPTSHAMMEANLSDLHTARSRLNSLPISYSMRADPQVSQSQGRHPYPGPPCSVADNLPVNDSRTEIAMASNYIKPRKASSYSVSSIIGETSERVREKAAMPHEASSSYIGQSPTRRQLSPSIRQPPSENYDQVHSEQSMDSCPAGSQPVEEEYAQQESDVCKGKTLGDGGQELKQEIEERVSMKMPQPTEEQSDLQVPYQEKKEESGDVPEDLSQNTALASPSQAHQTQEESEKEKEVSVKDEYMEPEQFTEECDYKENNEMSPLNYAMVPKKEEEEEEEEEKEKEEKTGTAETQSSPQENVKESTQTDPLALTVKAEVQPQDKCTWSSSPVPSQFERQVPHQMSYQQTLSQQQSIQEQQVHQQTQQQQQSQQAHPQSTQQQQLQQQSQQQSQQQQSQQQQSQQPPPTPQQTPQQLPLPPQQQQKMQSQKIPQQLQQQQRPSPQQGYPGWAGAVGPGYPGPAGQYPYGYSQGNAGQPTAGSPHPHAPMAAHKSSNYHSMQGGYGGPYGNTASTGYPSELGSRGPPGQQGYPQSHWYSSGGAGMDSKVGWNVWAGQGHQASNFPQPYAPYPYPGLNQQQQKMQMPPQSQHPSQQQQQQHTPQKPSQPSPAQTQTVSQAQSPQLMQPQQVTPPQPQIPVRPQNSNTPQPPVHPSQSTTPNSHTQPPPQQPPPSQPAPQQPPAPTIPPPQPPAQTRVPTPHPPQVTQPQSQPQSEPQTPQSQSGDDQQEQDQHSQEEQQQQQQELQQEPHQPEEEQEEDQTTSESFTTKAAGVDSDELKCEPKLECPSSSNSNDSMPASNSVPKKPVYKIGPKSKTLAAKQYSQIDDLDDYKCTITVHENGSLNGYGVSSNHSSSTNSNSQSYDSSDSEVGNEEKEPTFVQLRPVKRRKSQSREGVFIGPKRIKQARLVRERQERRHRHLEEQLRQTELEEQMQASRVEKSCEEDGPLGNMLVQSSIILSDTQMEEQDNVEQCIANIKAHQLSMSSENTLDSDNGDKSLLNASGQQVGKKVKKTQASKVFHNENSVIVKSLPRSLSLRKLRAKDFKWSHYIKSMRYWCGDCAHGFRNQKEVCSHSEDRCKWNCLYMLECYVIVKDVQAHAQFGPKVQELLEEYQIDGQHKCKTCGEIIERKADFLVHVDSHKDFMPWECTICGTRFKIRGSLKEHLRYTHMKGRVPCLKCNKVFPTSTLLRQHVKVHTQHYKYKTTKNRDEELKAAMEATAGALEATPEVVEEEAEKLSDEANEYRNWCKLMEINAMKNIGATATTPTPEEKKKNGSS